MTDKKRIVAVVGDGSQALSNVSKALIKFGAVASDSGIGAIPNGMNLNDIELLGEYKMVSRKTISCHVCEGNKSNLPLIKQANGKYICLHCEREENKK